MSGFKQPVSVLVVIHSTDGQILLLERVAHAGYWQSVTGSQEGSESLIETAQREVAEETGIITSTRQIKDWQVTNTFEIFAEWRHRYAPGVSHNTEHVFSLEIADAQPISLAPDEHSSYQWLPWREAAAKCFSWSNRDAILRLGEKSAR
jgi:dihydroneopterin triphosphate diphosphatase